VFGRQRRRRLAAGGWRLAAEKKDGGTSQLYMFRPATDVRLTELIAARAAGSIVLLTVAAWL
jgi:hypothetical protein